MKYFFTFIFFLSTFTFGCSCREFSVKEIFDNVDAVFIGKVIAVDSSKYDYSSNKVYAYTFEITKDFKRKHEGKNQKFYTTIYTPLENLFGGCGITFKLNETYLVYGIRTDVGTMTNMCMKTLDLKFVEKNELDSLQLLSNQFFKNKKNILDVDSYGDYSNQNHELLTEYENEILKLKSTNKIYIIIISLFSVLLLLSLFFNLRKK